MGKEAALEWVALIRGGAGKGTFRRQRWEGGGLPAAQGGATVYRLVIHFTRVARGTVGFLGLGIRRGGNCKVLWTSGDQRAVLCKTLQPVSRAIG
jgi:hypothetical protein